MNNSFGSRESYCFKDRCTVALSLMNNYDRFDLALYVYYTQSYYRLDLALPISTLKMPVLNKIGDSKTKIMGTP